MKRLRFKINKKRAVVKRKPKSRSTRRNSNQSRNLNTTIDKKLLILTIALTIVGLIAVADAYVDTLPDEDVEETSA